MPLEWGLTLLDGFESALDALDTALETCEEAPPSVGTAQMNDV